MGRESEGAERVLRDIWRAESHSAAELEAELGHGKACKAMKHIGFGGGAEPVDDDLRAAWRARLAREGKLRVDGRSAVEPTEHDPR
ncbi:hypothetical protein ACFFQW_18375 [Umezawaea endophytica]|uniref:Uncharacterized protein n=1 Tax=Umezawaea endophytica TaxID=1654476 RepID=A0A9X2VKW8_9PSEU|nr:hypothetical protein [Umezawaea endophytica]MCS7478495.1 hypothetical protein [Umezawaea endophytica]